VVTAPGQRYHPAIIAQAIATLLEMFPGRLWVALGSGEASNEHITGSGWPRKPVREHRLRECVDVMRALLAGEEVSHNGLITVDRARLWTRPEHPPPLIGAAVSVETARWVGEWADGLVTIKQPREHLERMIDAFRGNGGDDKPLYLQVHVSWADAEDEALAIAHDQWRSNVFPPPVSWDLELPAHFDEASAYVRPEDMRGAVEVSADLGYHAAWLSEMVDLGFDGIWIHHVGKSQRAFLEAFGDKVLPQVRGSRDD
jgi:probable non-F420 flavinoid oxidoreductase